MVEEQGGPIPRAPLPPPPSPDGLGLRGVLVATGLAVALIAATAAGAAVISRSHTTKNASAAATATPTPARTPTPRSTPTPDLSTPQPVAGATPTPDLDAALSAARTAPATKPGVVVDLDVAGNLVRTLWPVRELALSQRNAVAVRAIENGPAGEWDAISCTMGCPPPSPRALRDAHYFVPRQTGYPASFMAQVLTTEYHSSGALVEIMIFTRVSATAPWFLTFNTNYSGIGRVREFPTFDFTTHFEADLPADPTHQRVTLPAVLADYWQHWATTGAAPASTQLVNGYFTTQFGEDIAATRLDMRRAGINSKLTYSYNPKQDGVWMFTVNAEDSSGRLVSNDVLTCATVRYTDVNTPLSAGSGIAQGRDYMPYGTLLPPGQYSTVTQSGLHQSCLLTHPGETPIEVEGMNGEQTSLTGVPFDGASSA